MILSNQALCLKCGDMPYSTHRHDFKECKCGSIAVDGGMSYLRRVGGMDSYEELSISVPDVAKDAAIEAIQKAIDSGRNPLGILCATMIALRDNGVKVDAT
jgi:hypothetical protein